MSMSHGAMSQSKTIAASDVNEKKLYNFIRSKILALGDSIKNVTYNIEASELSIEHSNGQVTKQFINHLDIAGISWEINNNALRMQISSSNPNFFADEFLWYTIDNVYSKAADLVKIWPDKSSDSLAILAESILRLRLFNKGYKNEEIRVDEDHNIYVKRPYTICSFNLNKIASEPNFQDVIANAYKKLIKFSLNRLKN